MKYFTSKSFSNIVHEGSNVIIMEKKVMLEILVLGRTHLTKLLLKALQSRKVTLVSVHLNFWDDNKAQKLAPPAILCP